MAEKTDNTKDSTQGPPLISSSISTSEDENCDFIGSTFGFSYIALINEKLPDAPVFLEDLISSADASVIFTTNVPSFNTMKQ